MSSYVKIPESTVNFTIGSGSRNPSIDEFCSIILENFSLSFCPVNLTLNKIFQGLSLVLTDIVSDCKLILYFSLNSLFFSFNFLSRFFLISFSLF